MGHATDLILPPDASTAEAVERVVGSFRRAWRRGDRPTIEAFLPDGAARRRDALLELIHEEMDLRAEGGEVPRLAPYLARFPEIAEDPDLLGELARAEAALRRRMAKDQTATLHPVGAGDLEAGDASGATPARIGRYEL